jgi:SPP1 family predicted phage head-tail adaptor
MSGAGDLDRRITIQRATIARDTLNSPIKTWVTVATIAAGKRDTRAGERFVMQQADATIDTVFRIRWRTDVKPSMRVLCEGLYYDIKGIVELGRHDKRELLCTAHVP